MYNLPLTILQNEDWTYTVLSNIFSVVTEWNTLEEALNNWKEALSCHIEWLQYWDDEWEVLQSFKNSFNTYVTI